MNELANKKADIAMMQKAYHHGDLRKTLLDVAVELLQSDGEAGLSMRKLATQIGVSRSAPYHYFKNKEELLCAIAEEGFKRFEKIVNKTHIQQQSRQTQSTNKKNEDATSKCTFSAQEKKQKLRDFVESYTAFAIEHQAYYDLMFSGKLWKSTQLTTSLKNASYLAFKAFVGQVDQWQKQDILPSNLPALRLAQVCWSALHGMSRLMIDGIYIDAVDAKAKKAMCDSLVKVFLHQ